VILSRALQANHYGLFVLQTSLCFVLLAESLAQDWHLAEVRLQLSKPHKLQQGQESP
jgi:hypothetical protein